MNDIPELYQKNFESVYHTHPNHAHKDWREITEAEFARSSFFTYSPIAEGYRHLIYDYNGDNLDEQLSMRIYYMWDGTGFGLYSDYWKKKLRFFRFGCAHTYREYGAKEAQEKGWPHESWRCYHNTVCTKCGHFFAYDSSD